MIALDPSFLLNSPGEVGTSSRSAFRSIHPYSPVCIMDRIQRQGAGDRLTYTWVWLTKRETIFEDTDV